MNPKFSTDLGVPQGSVISPLLFILFIVDMFEDVTSHKAKFADDGTIWRTGSDVDLLATALKNDLECVKKWTERWRLKMNVEKTETCCFSKTTTSETRISLRGNQLKYNDHPKLLGVHLDESLKFSKHISATEQKANRSVGLLAQLSKVEGFTTKNLLRVYKALVQPILEYASPVWQNAGDCQKLEEVQRKGLALCLGVPLTSSREALEVELAVKPLEIRRLEIAIREASRILRKEDSEPLKANWLQWEENQKPERITSPFGKMQLQLEDMKEATSVTLHNIEHEFTFSEGLCLTRQRPEYWDRLGSSKNRTDEQRSESRQTINQLLQETDIGTVVAFTDGSCQPNPGPCGAGACIFPPYQTNPVELSRPVSNFGSIMLGELVAILITLQFILSEINKLGNCRQCLIMSDSQSSVGVLTLGWESSKYRQTIADIRELIDRLYDKGMKTQIEWTPGLDADIRGNELADSLAKKAASAAADLDPSSDVLTLAHQTGMHKWQKLWDNSERGRTFYKLKSRVDSKTLLDCPNKKISKIIHELRLGYGQLRGYRHLIGLEDSNKCDCGEVETVEHFLLHCDNYNDIREQLRLQFWRQTGFLSFTLEDILFSDKEPDNKDSSKPDMEICYTLLGQYISESGRFN